MYVIYNEVGAVIGTIIGPGKDYGPQYLDKNNQQWLFLSGRTALDPRFVYVDIETKTLVDKTPMSLAINKTEFIADNNDKAIISQIPEGATVHVTCNGASQFADSIGTDTIELVAVTPASYLIAITHPKYLPFNIEIKAIANADNNQT